MCLIDERLKKGGKAGLHFPGVVSDRCFMMDGNLMDELLGFLMFLLALMLPLGGAAFFVMRKGSVSRGPH